MLHSLIQITVASPPNIGKPLRTGHKKMTGASTLPPLSYVRSLIIENYPRPTINTVNIPLEN